MACSGVANALVRMRVSDLFDTRYGWLVLAKLAAPVCARSSRLAAATDGE